MKRYILATEKEWNLTAFTEHRNRLRGSWAVVTARSDLETIADSLSPRFVFFPHWSHIVPENFLERHECVCFHMTDVPYGRGGSPLQNLIARGHDSTLLTALRMTKNLDAGPVYLKKPLSLEGSGAQIFKRAAGLCMEMIAEIVDQEPAPVPQVGTATYFPRRTPAQSALPELGDIAALYDHIRMLDAPGYPHAFMRLGNLRGEFTQAEMVGDALEAKVRFSAKREKEQ